VFAGKIDRSALTLPEKAMVKALRVAEGDYRDRDEVEKWARSIAGSLG
jgi:menaquinone-dependent protoporphyrinogen oxidase